MIIGMKREGIPIDMILFADTGGERPHTYAFIETFNKWLVANSLPQIQIVKYTDQNGNIQTLEEECLRLGVLPAVAYGYKSCSQKYKIGVQEKFCNNDPHCQALWSAGGKINKFVGYDAGEARRVEHAKVKAAAEPEIIEFEPITFPGFGIEKLQPQQEAPKKKSKIEMEENKFEKTYFLFDKGWTREKCVDVILSEGLPAPGKSSCFFCSSMRKEEIQDLYLHDRELFDRAVAMEENAAPNLDKVKGLGRRWSWKDYINDWQEVKEYAGAQTMLEQYEDAPGGCLCGMPCGCYDG